MKWIEEKLLPLVLAFALGVIVMDIAQEYQEQSTECLAPNSWRT